MKTACALFLLLTIGSAMAEIRFPSNSYTIDQIAEAQKSAEAKGRPIAFIYANKATTCGLCVTATDTIIDALKMSAVLVYVADAKDAPAQVASALNARGKFIPKVVVFDAKLENNLGMVTYEEIKEDGEKPLRALKSQIRKAKAT